MNIDYHKCEACGVAKADIDEAMSMGQENKVQIDELVQTLIAAHNKTSNLETFFHGELLKMKAQRDEARKIAGDFRDALGRKWPPVATQHFDWEA